MRLDHFVFHIDADDAKLAALAQAAQAVGMPFEPREGKGTRGFRACNIWAGDQYFELTRLLRPDGGGWRKEWVDACQKGHRGMACLFLRVDDIASLKRELLYRGVEVREEKVAFKVLGLFTKTMPWTTLHLPRLPGTKLEISFIAYDTGFVERWIPTQKPNARDHGIDGIASAEISVPQYVEAAELLSRVFPQAKVAEDRLEIQLGSGRLTLSRGPRLATRLTAAAGCRATGTRSFQIEDTEVVVPGRSFPG